MMKGSDKMHIKKLASTLMKKNLIVTFTVVTAISLGILTGCGAYQQANADPLTQPTTQIEQMVEDEHQENEASGDVSGNATQEATQETSSEQQELQNQDEDPIENNDNKPNTETTDTTPSTEQAHVHTWTTETRYRTETQTIHHEAEYNIVHHDAQTIHHPAETREETRYNTVHHDGTHHDADYYCRECGAHFTSDAAASAHIDATEHTSGYEGSPAWDEDGWDEQVPYTVTVTVKEAWDEVIPAYDEKILVKDAWDETITTQVPYTVTVCSDCHAEK